jgi:hypothetical protein
MSSMPISQLVDLLLGLFTVEEMRHLALRMPGGEGLAATLPGDPVDALRMGRILVLGLSHRGLLGEPLRTYLESRRPQKVAEFDRLMRRVPEEMASTPLPGPNARDEIRSLEICLSGAHQKRRVLEQIIAKSVDPLPDRILEHQRCLEEIRGYEDRLTAVLPIGKAP